MWTQSCEILNPYEALCEAREREKNVERRKMTNGDRIRSMTDEELIKMLEYHRSDCESCSYPRLYSSDCEDCFAEWLRQEVEE